MEEILRKNIFNEKDLLKHSPDYHSQDIYLRMQLRRHMAPNTFKYTHEALKCNMSKKENKKTKSCHKLEREMVKLRDQFEKMNLHNQSKLKNVKKINKIKSTKNISYSLQLDSGENEMIENELALYINQSANDNDDLIIENDSNFKLVPNENKKIQDVYHCLRNAERESSVLDLDKKTNQRKNDNLKKIKFSLNANSIYPENKTQNGICISQSQCNEFKNDLQSLLIMMTINSNISENMTPDDKFCQTEISQEAGECAPKDSHLTSIDLEHSYNTQTIDLVPLLNVISIGRDLDYREKYIANKFLIKWKCFVDKRKENNVLKKRQETLNKFFDKLSKKKNNALANQTEPVQKANNFAKDYNTYQHRYKVQKHIIALQKTKLEEQNKLIDQLKYNKIVEASRQSLDTMRDDVRKTYYEIDRHLKPKIKCLTNELKIKEFEEPSLVLHCLKVPQFLQRMEARAREREEKHAMIRERRKQLEEERMKQKQQVEIAKAEMDKEEKMKRIKELREKRKKEKIENIRKKQYAERLRALTVMADLHYERNLMSKYGIRPLRYLIEMKHDNIEKARAHYRFQLIKNVLLHWMWHTEDMWFDRNYKAEDFYRKKILKKTFAGFKNNHHESILKKQVAEDYYDLYVTQQGFKRLCEGIEISKKECELKLKKAIVYYNSNILFKTFTCWRTLPALNALKRQQDIRKSRWREKVLLVVPDYQPPED